MSTDERASRPSALDDPAILDDEVRLLGRITASSNGAHLVELVHSGALAIYKPDALERPLWDFPPGLGRRELAFRALAEFVGICHVPPIVVRHDLPYGSGTLQAFVDADFDLTYFELVEDQAHHESLAVIAALDIVANNADRKGSHVLLDDEGRLWAIDNALTFHPESKLRTVIWDLAGHPLPTALAARLASLADDLPDDLARLLEPEERRALIQRAIRLVRRGTLPPMPEHGRPYPWPPV